MRLYKGFGFTVSRQLCCLRLPDPGSLGTLFPSDGLRLRELGLSEAPWRILRPLRRYTPSWQNDMETFTAGASTQSPGAPNCEWQEGPGPKAVLGTEDDPGRTDPVVVVAEDTHAGTIAGFMICEADGAEILDLGYARGGSEAGTEDTARIAAKDPAKYPVVSTLLLELLRRRRVAGYSGPIKMLNVDARARELMRLLSEIGFESFVDQYEMILIL